MDMSAYIFMQGIDTEKLLKQLNIEIMRLRGIRFMQAEEKIPEEKIQKIIKEQKVLAVVTYLRQHSWDCWTSTQEERNLKKPAFIWGINEYGERDVIDYDFSKIHGKNRRALKLRFKQIERDVKAQFNMFNKYAGKQVLYIHARQGGGNRDWCRMDLVAKHPLYLGDVDDCYDGTYCDIYYDIKNVDIKEYVDEIQEIKESD